VTGPPGLKRRELYPHPLIDGREVEDRAIGRLRRRMDSLLVSRTEREEVDLERRLRRVQGVTRPNVIAVISPRVGVGKTTGALLVGGLLASHLKLRTVVLSTGSIGEAPHDLLDNLDRVATAAELRRHVSVATTGLHLLPAPADPSPGRCGELVAFLSCFYDAVLLDLGPGITRPPARLAIDRADQLVLTTTPDRLTATIVLHSLEDLPAARTTVLVNKAHPHPADEVHTVEECFRRRAPRRVVTLPFDRRLARMLDTGTYSLAALDARTRAPIKRLGLAVAEQLV
jgi:MinD-like ATPase involved in chromosome partitioning or flagellar assembly